jgi:Domain of unknown function (DUF4265)
VQQWYKEHPSPTGRFEAGQLVPVPEASAADTIVWWRLPPEADGIQVWEGLSAQRLTDDRAVVRAVPLFAYDVGYGDEVFVADSAEGGLVVTGVASDHGSYTFRVWLGDGAGDDVRAVVREFGELGCLIEGYSDKLVGLSCGPEQARTVADALHQAEQLGRLTYETGRQATS